MTNPTPRTGFAAGVAGLVQDGAFVAGAGLIVYGVALIYVPAAFIVAGALILGLAWRWARRTAQ